MAWLEGDPAARTQGDPLRWLTSADGVRLDLDDRLVLPDQDGACLRIGRGRHHEPCQHLTFYCSTVSTHHCRLERRDGAWRVEDNQSSGGTLLDGEPVRGSGVVADGGRISFGEVQLRLFASNPAPPRAVGAIAAGRVEDALVELLASWRRLPTARRGDWIEAVGEAVVDGALVAALGEPAVWLRAARDPGPADVSALLRTADPRERAHLVAMAAWPKDPRVARWLLAAPAPAEDAWGQAVGAHVDEVDCAAGPGAVPREVQARFRPGPIARRGAPFVPEDFDAFWAWRTPDPA